MFKKKVAWMLVLTLTLSLTGCGTESEDTADTVAEESEEGAKAGELELTEAAEVDESRTTTANSDEQYDKITIGVTSDPQDLLPCNPNVASKPYIYYNFYETLFELDNGEYVPLLAKDYTVIDELHYEVEIYDYIYDSEGNHITADDVIFSYEYLLDSGYALKYGSFESISKIDDYTVEFTWTKEITGVNELEFPWCRTFIFSQAAWEEHNFATAPVATGPYVVENFTSGSSVVLQENEDYWQEDDLRGERQQANVKTIQYDVIAEASQQVIALQTGTIDFSQYLSSENMEDFEEDGKYADGYNTWVTVGSEMYTLTTNMSADSPLQDIDLRMAVYYAIDNEACATVAGNSAAANGFGTPFFTDYVDEWDTTESYINTYDPELAAEYVEKSDYNGEVLKLLGGNDETCKNLLTIVQTFLLSVGIESEIQMVETVNIGNYATESEEWDIMISTLAGGTQIGSWNRAMNNEELANGMAMGFIDDPKLQELYEKANTVEFYGDESMTELHEYALEMGYYYALILPYQNIVYKEDIAEIYLRENNYILPGAFTYYLD